MHQALQGLQGLAIAAYISGFLRPGLLRVATYCALEMTGLREHAAPKTADPTRAENRAPHRPPLSNPGSGPINCSLPEEQR